MSELLGLAMAATYLQEVLLAGTAALKKQLTLIRTFPGTRNRKTFLSQPRTL